MRTQKKSEQPVETKCYKNVDEAYKDLFPSLTNYARRHLIDRDLAVDAIHATFSKVIQWHDKTKGHISHKIIFRLLLRVCRKMNRQNRFVSTDDPALEYYFRNV